MIRLDMREFISRNSEYISRNSLNSRLKVTIIIIFFFICVCVCVCVWWKQSSIMTKSMTYVKKQLASNAQSMIRTNERMNKWTKVRTENLDFFHMKQH